MSSSRTARFVPDEPDDEDHFFPAVENIGNDEDEQEETQGDDDDDDYNDNDDDDYNEEEEDEDDEDEDEDALGQGDIHISGGQIIQLLNGPNIRQLFRTRDLLIGALRGRGIFIADDDDDEGDDGGEGSTGYDPVRPPWRRKGAGSAAFEKVPSEAGKELMNSGVFGTNHRPEDTIKRSNRLSSQIMRRELGLGSNGRQRNASRLMRQDMIPQSAADTIIHYNKRCYSGQFSDDGNFFFSCSQDFKVRMYDTSNPYNWKYYKSVDYPYGQWTITDASLSPDNRFLAYSSITSVVCLAPTDPKDDSEPQLLDFSNNRHSFHSYFGIWSVRFSGDGRELVGGSGDNAVYVYDIERRQAILRIPGHKDDVNAVCFGDSQSPHLIYSGSDDTTLKVWDRRSMGDRREAGVFVGHTEGLTYVDSKGDGRYVLSNAKDQTMKLWDLRKMVDKDKADTIHSRLFSTGFEYRTDSYDFDQWSPHPHDCSLVTFRGHKVLKTLIRCHFSPPGSTDSRYVYSGSYDGTVYVWNMDATIAGKIDVLSATTSTREDEQGGKLPRFARRGPSSWTTCVRDAAWHPNAPILAG
ncbi:hypothetical protein N0V90_013327 [Kalmusia sp. IMI 367209]|nr:hypothetical protein N0V90_013327 [Kalmusia sp. IMI 367209]